MISPNIERWKIYFGSSSITRARHVLGALKVDFVNRIFKNQCIEMKMKILYSKLLFHMLLMQNYYTDKSILGHVVDQSTCIVRKGYGHYIMRYAIYLKTFLK